MSVSSRCCEEAGEEFEVDVRVVDAELEHDSEALEPTRNNTNAVHVVELEAGEQKCLIEAEEMLPEFLVDPQLQPIPSKLELNYNLPLLLIPMAVLWAAHPPWRKDNRVFPTEILITSGALLIVITLVLLIFTPWFYSRNGKTKIREYFDRGSFCSRFLMRLFNIRFEGLLPSFYILAFVCGYTFVYVNAIWISFLCKDQPKHVANSFHLFVADGFSVPIFIFLGNMICVAVAAGFNLSEFGESQEIRSNESSSLDSSSRPSETSSELATFTALSPKFPHQILKQNIESHHATIDELNCKLNHRSSISTKERDENPRPRYEVLRLQGIDSASIEKIKEFEENTVMKQNTPIGLFVFSVVLVLIAVSLWSLYPMFIGLDENVRNVYEGQHLDDIWDNAYAQCGGSLPILTNKVASDDFLWEIRSNDTWIGLRAINGVLTWSDGRLFKSSTDFFPNDESLSFNMNKTQCIAMNVEFSKWKVLDCSTKLHVACQFDPAFESVFWFYFLTIMSGLGILAPGMAVVGFLWAKTLSFYLRNLLYVKSLSMRNISEIAIKLKDIKSLSNWMKIRTFYLKTPMQHNYNIAAYSFASCLIAALICLLYDIIFVFGFPSRATTDATVQFLLFFVIVASVMMLTIMGIAILIYNEQKYHLKMLDIQKSELKLEKSENLQLISGVEETTHLIENYDLYPTVLGVPITQTTLRLVKTYLVTGISLLVAKVVSG